MVASLALRYFMREWGLQDWARIVQADPCDVAAFQALCGGEIAVGGLLGGAVHGGGVRRP